MLGYGRDASHFEEGIKGYPILVLDGRSYCLGGRRGPAKIYFRLSGGYHIGLKGQPKFSKILSELLVGLQEMAARKWTP